LRSASSPPACRSIVAGNLALVTNRADNSIGVLRIAGKKVTLIDTVAIGEQVAHVAFTPDGKRAVAAKFPGNKLALLEVNGEKVTYANKTYRLACGHTTSTSRPTASLRCPPITGRQAGPTGTPTR
jgi:DNA-binding beta-propeller fold protein YncE